MIAGRSGVRAAVSLVVLVVAGGCRGRHEGPGEIKGAALPAAVIEARETRQAEAIRSLEPAPPVGPPKQILFGDLHVHTTFSADAFAMSLPMMQGEGAHPPADACDFARYCSDLDFWSINDHAEGISPRHWRETKESIRQCNAVAGDPADPDVVAFLGWEWTQVGATPADHYGHKNVLFRDLAEDRVPARPISARSGRLLGAMVARPPLWQRLTIPLLDYRNRQRYFDFGKFQDDVRETPLCPEGVHVRELPADCHEVADTAEVLFEKLSQWGFDTIVIPHGTTWGLYTPPGTTFDKQLAPAAAGVGMQTLIEVYSGHGNSEEYRAWRAVEYDAAGRATCPAPTPDYEPCCWRAGEIIRARCGDPASAECEQRVAETRRLYVEGGVGGHLAVPGAQVEDWLDCGQCRDCFNPAFNYRPGNATQYTLAIRNFDTPAPPLGFRFGQIASSDNHTARPGTGYKEYARQAMTEATGPRDAGWRGRLGGPLVNRGREHEPTPVDEVTVGNVFQFLEGERQASFFMTGGLVAVHAEGRGRDAIWRSLKRREVYGTSGDRVLLWFDLLDGPRGTAPMGSEVVTDTVPRFRVRAVGSFEQRPGCPDYAVRALGAERLKHLCRGECYHPGDRRRLITRIEVVRIRPQQYRGEPVARLIEDAWRTFPCPPSPAGCVVEFDDPQFPVAGRETVYYVRAIQEPSPAVNAGGLRCERDAAGACTRVRPCYGDFRTPFDDDCLTDNEERAWSSPIFVLPGPSAAARTEG
jgi:hypothetical protein